MSKTKLGRLQTRIMQVLWERRRATAREITETLNQEEEVAHSTVQTLLRQLEEKGSLTHQVEERTFIYVPLVEQQSVAKSATRELIERIFGGQASGLVSYLLKEEKIPPKELEAIRKLIEEKEKRGK
ncbi:BlaI/MecI/CopY family transcriptional regulator [Schlesneria paludicola]|uniref:BlaI/MecI/CopY family transcriptional regulator n=1 Tax=Schlesneria paludicola TaxID=360056 RepID=UPI00029A1C77|nr:BlaI/MecI/CopY family transcriptional regulator [Schlesneria paludicola]